MKAPTLYGFIITATLMAATLFIMDKCHAGEAQLTWVAPTQNCNGTSLTNLTGYSLTYGQNRVELPKVLTHTVTGLAPGTWWFSLAAVTPTDRSEFVTIEKEVLPEEFTVATPDAYALVKRVDRLVLSRVGSVPVGTVCNAAETVNGKYVVPRAAVTWSGSVKPDVVVATCQ